MEQWRYQTWIRWLPLLLALVCSASFGAPLIKLTKDFTQADLAQYSDVLVDSSLQLTADQIAHESIANNFSSVSSTQLLHIDQHNVYWLRFGVDNPLATARVLALNLRIPDNVIITAFDGAMQPLQLQRAPLLQLLIPPLTKQLYYLRIGPGAIEIAQLELLSIERYLAANRIQAWLSATLQSGLLLCGGVAIFIGLWRGDRAFGWFAGYCVALSLWQFFFRTEFMPLSSDRIPDWTYRNLFLQSCLLISNVCCIRLAQCLPITQSRDFTAINPLTLLLVATALSSPIVFLLPTFSGATLTTCLLLLTQASTIAIALYNFLVFHRRELMYYTLLRTLTFALSIGGTLAWQTSSSLRTLTDNLLPLAMVAEAIGLFGILLWRSFEQQRNRNISERDIAVLEAEARGRTEVIAEVGHRVRTPISGVIGMLDMLQDTSLSATQLDYINTLRRASNELLNAADDISDLSRLQNQAYQLQPNIFDPHALITECIDGFRSAATAHRLELINDIDPDLPSYVSGDLTRLRQIILQLLQHIVGHYERGDVLLCVNKTQNDRLHFTLQTRAITLPIAASASDRPINSPNVRLAIVRQLIETLRGELRIDTKAHGNLDITFDLELPIVERYAHNAILDTTLQGKHLLVIDDNATLCSVLERQLSHWGMRVYTAHSATEGLARLRNQITVSQPIDALLIDTDIPELQQGDWMKRFRSEAEPPPMIICLSNEPASHSAMPAQGWQRTLLKPVNHTSLKITLIEAFKQRAQRPVTTPQMRNQTIRCLFAEDNLINAKVLSGMLDKLGVTHTAANNGQEAVDACRRAHFDIVLMDWDMPVMDGWEASRRIREMFDHRGLPSMPIIALTANTVEELGERARQSMMDAHMVKPIQLHSLRELLEQWTGKIVAPPGDLPN